MLVGVAYGMAVEWWVEWRLHQRMWSEVREEGKGGTVEGWRRKKLDVFLTARYLPKTVG